jgi:hypothetical protein
MIRKTLNGKDIAKPAFVQVRGMIISELNQNLSDLAYCAVL